MSQDIEAEVTTMKADKGYGFLRVPGRTKDVFFHIKQLRNGSMDKLQVGDKVLIGSVESTPKGESAINVRAIL